MRLRRILDIRRGSADQRFITAKNLGEGSGRAPIESTCASHVLQLTGSVHSEKCRKEMSSYNTLLSDIGVSARPIRYGCTFYTCLFDGLFSWEEVRLTGVPANDIAHGVLETQKQRGALVTSCLGLMCSFPLPE